MQKHAQNQMLLHCHNMDRQSQLNVHKTIRNVQNYLHPSNERQKTPFRANNKDT